MAKRATGSQTLAVIPLYKQLSQLIEKEITNGKWKQGDKIPSEAELVDMYSISRITVRAALEELVDSGHLIKIQGKGTFVSRAAGKKMLSIGTSSFAEMCRQNNLEARRIQIEKRMVDADERDMELLGLQKGDQILRLVRVLCADGEPMILATDHIHPRFSELMDIDLENNSLNEMMIKTKKIKKIKSNDRSIELCLATAKEAEYLKTTVGAPMLLLRDIAIDDKGIPVRRTKEILIGDRIRIEYRDLTP